MDAKLIFLLCFLNYVCCEEHERSLTESMGQEVIEIGAPVKELPQELEEEPSAENVDEKLNTTSVQVATKNEFAKITIDPYKKVKDIDKIDGRRREDEETRIEKELADIYKDSLDYKGESAEVTKEANVTSPPEKPVERSRNGLKFQPDSNNPRDIARFRTSIDEISCANKLAGSTKIPAGNAAGRRQFTAEIFIWIAFISKYHIQ